MRVRWCPRMRQHVSRTRPKPLIKPRKSVFFPVALALLLLPPIACASPPDPSWIAGIYDAADGDDIVALVYEIAGTQAASWQAVSPIDCLSELLVTLVPRIAHSLSAGQLIRGPPWRPDPIFSDTAYVPALASVPLRHAPKLQSPAHRPHTATIAVVGNRAAWLAARRVGKEFVAFM